jgi:hypothetical protein
MNETKQQEISRKILERVGFKLKDTRWTIPGLIMWTDGREDAREMPNLYSKENQWILFEYVIPKFANASLDWQPNSWAVWIADSGLCVNKSLSEALIEAIIKSIDSGGV